ncbi:hypothetical protein [Streptomyces filamentosus]|uniref:hypothetical protein n=1 Tax=Streptomyces filamentosus TaxID=67294 RepID=UPI0033CA3FF5
MARGLAALAVAFGTVPAGSGTADAAMSDGAAVSASCEEYGAGHGHDIDHTSPWGNCG